MHKMLRLAVTLAEDNPGVKDYKLGAVIAKRNKPLAVGLNSYKTHPLQARFARRKGSVCLHAEIDAIQNFVRKYGVEKLSKCTLYVARVKKSGERVIAKPCKGCQRAIMAFDIGNVVWTE